MKLENFTNDQLTFEKDQEGFVVTLHQKTYNTEEVLNIAGWLHQVGVTHPEEQIKIGARIK